MLSKDNTTEENRRIWADALRSGEYQQGHGYLKRLLLLQDDGSTGTVYCCLGVACELSSFGDWTPRFVDENGELLPGPATYSYGDGKFEEFPPPRVAELLGLFYDGSNEPGLSLAAMNDAEVSFAEIADFIERRGEIFDRDPQRWDEIFDS